MRLKKQRTRLSRIPNSIIRCAVWSTAPASGMPRAIRPSSTKSSGEHQGEQKVGDHAGAGDQEVAPPVVPELAGIDRHRLGAAERECAVRAEEEQRGQHDAHPGIDVGNAD